MLHYSKLRLSSISAGGGGGGGGHLGNKGGNIRSLSDFKFTPKGLISGQKSTLFYKKPCLFPVKKEPSFFKALTKDEREQVLFASNL